MSKYTKPKMTRRDFLKGFGIASSGTLFSLLVGHEQHTVLATPNDNQDPSLLKEVSSQTVGVVNYKLETADFPPQYFLYCTNMGSVNECIEQKLVIRDREIIQVLPGQLTYNDIFLERELTTNMTLWEWQEMVIEGTNFRKNGSIIALDDSLQQIARWDFINAWPREVNATLLPIDQDPNTYVLLEHTILTLEDLYKSE